jgi:DMSO/TMAO reductase YedYZ molybdopterin-dependent catalytic subunit
MMSLAWRLIMPINKDGEAENLVSEPLSVEDQLRRRTRRGFLGLGIGAAAAFAGWEWLMSGTYEEGDIPPRLRSILRANEAVIRKTIYSNSNLVKTYPASAIGNIKVNGEFGLDDDVEPDDWRLEVVPFGHSDPALRLDLDDLHRLPRYEETIDFKCIEGWSTVTQFAGARFSDFTAKFARGSAGAPSVAMQTPDGEYYVGLDMASALHPQTLLAWEMNGEALEDEHGAPLRLVIPVKYGIKNIKRIGKIEYVPEPRPDDYWAERGYDWYAGL